MQENISRGIEFYIVSPSYFLAHFSSHYSQPHPQIPMGAGWPQVEFQIFLRKSVQKNSS